MNFRKVILLSFCIAAVAFIGFYYWSNRNTTIEASKPVTDVSVKEKNDGGASPLGTALTTNTQGQSISGPFTLNGSKDYAELKAYYEPLAKKGDSQALKTIAQIYEYCMSYSLSPSKFEAGIDSFANLKPENKPRLETIKQLTKRRCEKLDGGLPITLDLLDLSWRQALVAGDALTGIKLATSDGVKEDGELDALVHRAAQRKEADAIFAIGDLLALNSNSKEYGKVAGAGMYQYAWQIVACRSGGMSMCGAGSNILNGVCLNTGGCNYSSYEELVRNGLIGRTEQPALDQAIRDVESKIKN